MGKTIESNEQIAQRLAKSWYDGDCLEVRNEIETWAFEHRPTGCWLAIRVHEILQFDYANLLSVPRLAKEFKDFFLED